MKLHLKGLLRQGVVIAISLSMGGCDSSSKSSSPKPTVSSSASLQTSKGALTQAPSALGEGPGSALEVRRLSRPEVSLFVVHQVSSAATFLSELRKNDAAREKAGVVKYSVSQSVKDEERFVIHYLVESKSKLDAFLDSAEYERLLSQSQGSNSSLLWESKPELALSLSELPRPSASLFKKFPVQDLAKLRSTLEKQKEALLKAGAFELSLHRSSADPKVAILLLRARDPESLRRIYEAPLLQQAFADAGASKTKDPLIAKDLR